MLHAGDAPFQVTGALHSYFAVDALPKLKISGPFKGATYVDKTVDPAATKVGTSNELKISASTESLYQDVWGELALTEIGSVVGIKVTSPAFASSS
jgi:D-hexose-6-phosphate mutarotase